MQHETEVHFCNICNSSIPESAVRDGLAVRVAGKMVPTAACGNASVEVGRPARGALLGVAFLVLMGIAGAAVFIDWRLSQSAAALRGDLEQTAPRLGRLEDRLAGLEDRLGSVVRGGQLTPITEELKSVGDRLAQNAAQLDQRFAAADRSAIDMREQVQRVADAEVQHAARLALLQDDVRALGRDLSELRASPSTAVPTRVVDDGMAPGPEPIAPNPVPAESFAPAVQHHLDRLTDADESVRFEAVQELLATGDPLVLSRILPLAKDTDFFVRRLVLEGLADRRSPDHVEVLLTALADPESLVRHSAYQGLKKLTGQSLPFDADANNEQRAAMQKRWRAWWDKNKDGF